MKKILSIIIALGFVAMLAVPAFASDSRVTALAGAGKYLEDDYNIFDWPATLPSYSNTVWMSVHNAYWDDMDWSWSHYSDFNNYFTMIGASYAFGEDGHYGTLAMFFQNFTPGLNKYHYYQDVYADILWNKYTLMYGYSMDKVSLGIYISRADTYDKEVTPGATEEDKSAYTTIGASARFDVVDKAYADVAFDVSFASYQDENDPTYGDITDDDNLKYGVRARMFYEYNETVTFIPYVGYSAYDFSLKADSTDYTDTHWGDKCWAFDIGIGANIKVNEDNMLLFAVEPFSYMKGEPSAAPDSVVDEFTYTVIPRFYLALESDVKDWLTFRVGGMKELGKWDEKSGGTSTEYKDVNTWGGFQYFMGLGFHVGDFDIDCVINNELPYHMGYWLTGYGWGGDDGYYGSSVDHVENAPAYMVTGTYHF